MSQIENGHKSSEKNTVQTAQEKTDLLDWNTGSLVDATCPVCNTKSLKAHVVSVATPMATDGKLHFYACGTCASKFPYPYSQPPYDDDYGFEEYTRFYCELGAGIDFMIRPIEMVNKLVKVKRFLDAGCGFGFTVDFAQRVLGARAIGFDPSFYAREGGRLLGVDIRPEYLAENSQLDFDSADMILCSEVIEHVENPEQFVRMLKGKLAQDGVIVFTTPSSAWVDPSKGFIDVLECLFPGFHRQLFSSRALHDVLSRVGFRFVKVLEDRQRLVAFASLNTDVTKINEMRTDHREMYHQYLKLLIEAHSTDRGPIFSGALFRAFKEALNAGDARNVTKLSLQFQGFLSDLFNMDLGQIESIKKVEEEVRAMPGLTALRPYHLPAAFFYLGLFHLNVSGKIDLANAFFSAAARMTRHILVLPQPFLAEPASLYWLMVYHAGVANLIAGSRDVALNWFQEIFDAALAMPQDLVQTNLRAEDVGRSKLQAGIAHLQLGANERAAKMFSEALESPNSLSEGERVQASAMLSATRSALSGNRVAGRSLQQLANASAITHRSRLVWLGKRYLPKALHPLAKSILKKFGLS